MSFSIEARFCLKFPMLKPNQGIKFRSLFLVLGILLSFAPMQVEAEENKESVNFSSQVRIKSYQQDYDWLNPWNKKDVVPRSGVGSVIRVGEKQWMLLTSADLVSNATLIEAKRTKTSLPSRMYLKRIDHAPNLALLESDDASFFSGMRGLEWGNPEKGQAELPDLSSGRIELMQGEITGLTVGHRQVRDAWLPILQLGLKKIPPQGSIVLQKQKAVGMVLNGSQGNYNVLPKQLINKFLSQSAGPDHDRFSHRGFQWQFFAQPSLAEFSKIPENQEGIWISRVLPYGTGSEVLQAGDYLTRIGDWQLNREGQIEHSKWGNVLFDVLFLEDLDAGDEVELGIYRGGQSLNLKTKVGTYRQNGHRVPMKIFGKPPRYLIRGGMIFQELTLNYLEVWGQNWENRAPLRLRLFKQLDLTRTTNASGTKPIKHSSRERIVILSQVLPDVVNIGYQELRNMVVKKVNGKRVVNLESMVEALQNPQTGFHRVEFLPGSERVQIVLPVQELVSADERIMKNFQIPRLQSL